MIPTYLVHSRKVDEEKMSRRKSFVMENDNNNICENASSHPSTIGKKPKRQRSITFSQFENLKSLDIISSEECDDVETAAVGKNWGSLYDLIFSCFFEIVAFSMKKIIL